MTFIATFYYDGLRLAKYTVANDPEPIFFSMVYLSNS